MRFVFVGFGLGLVSGLWAADLPSDPGMEIPEAARREVVLRADVTTVKPPELTITDGYELRVAAAAPLVRHPIMGCVDDKGRLFVGDAVGVNWNREQLDAGKPNRILMLEDEDGDGVFDKSTVFADGMTFPQGGCWVDGSLYVCSPPSLWKLTDTDGDGVADERLELVTGFDYTGNAADVHGPKLHPNGRLYWCHGRKGHRVRQKDGTVVHEGKASGIWSCALDGSEVRWHALGCADNPTGLDFTEQGDVLGTCNLYASNPRGDTLMHWLYGGVYERADQLAVIEDLPRSLSVMPVLRRFGHVAVSGCAFWRSEKGVADAEAPLMVTHFNTQRLVRMPLRVLGSTFVAEEQEFLKLHDAGVHLTDVMEDPRDGSLLLINTGGWFRNGCPSSLVAKPDELGAVYRIRAVRRAPVERVQAEWVELNAERVLGALESGDLAAKRRALDWLNEHVEEDAVVPDGLQAAVRDLIGADLDAPLEHALITFCRRHGVIGSSYVLKAENLGALRHALLCFTAEDSFSLNEVVAVAGDHLDSLDASLAEVAMSVVVNHPDADEWITPKLKRWLLDADLAPHQLRALEVYVGSLIEEEGVRDLLGAMLGHESDAARATAVGVLAGLKKPITAESVWLPLLRAELMESPSVRLLDAIGNLQTKGLKKELEALANDKDVSLTLRLKALAMLSEERLSAGSFALMLGALQDDAVTMAARVQAAALLGRAVLAPDQLGELAGVYGKLGALELEYLLPVIRKMKDEVLVRAAAESLALNPVLISKQESLYRTVFSGASPAVFEEVLLPSYRAAEQVMEEKKQRLGSLAARVSMEGDADRGRVLFEQGKGSCLACHQVGDVGRAIGPNLSTIGAIRNERDLVESILLPSATLARDYESHLFEMRDGQVVMGVIRSHTAEGLLVVDVAGQERNLVQQEIVSQATLPTSLMPMGLDQTMSETELLDLVAYLMGLGR